MAVAAPLNLTRSGHVVIGDDTHKYFHVAAVMDSVGDRLIALAAGISHNWLIGAPHKRSLIAYDH